LLGAQLVTSWLLNGYNAVAKIRDAAARLLLPYL
jgi:hypothetical protein